MTLKDLGHKIKLAREEKNMKLEDIAQKIKLSVTNLRAIEDGDTSILPHAVYTKGFVRSYALSVGIEHEEIKEMLEQVFSAEIAEDATPEATFSSNYNQQNKSKSTAFYFFIVLLLGVLLFGGWFVSTKYGSDIVQAIKKPFSTLSAAPAGEEDAENHNAIVPAPLQPTEDAENITPPAMPEGAQPVAPTVEDSAAPGEASAQTLAPQAEAPAPEQPLPSEDAVAVVSPATTGKNEVEITAAEECYIRVQRENFSPVHYTMNPNETYKVRFNQRLGLVVGNAGGVSVKYNGKDIGSVGEKSQRRELTFPLAR